ncbi:MAG: TRAP transporter substrate-binding protein [Silicimonas sp.]
MKYFSRTMLFALSCSVFAQVTAANAETIRVAHADNEAHPKHLAFLRFVEKVSELSGGDLTVEVFPSGQLGGERELVEALQTGAVQITSVSNGVMSAFSDQFMLLDIPFLFSNAEQARSAIDASQDELFVDLDAIGLHGLAIWEQGFRELSSSAPVESVSDLVGFKVRTMEAPLHVAAWKAAGANPTPMSWGQVYPSLQTGVIDGQENPLYVVTQEKLFEVQKNVTLTHHIYDAMPVVADGNWWNGLPDADKNIITEAMSEATEYERSLVGEEVENARAELAGLGVTVAEFPEEEREKLKASAQQTVVETVAAKLGKNTVDSWLSKVGN